MPETVIRVEKMSKRYRLGGGTASGLLKDSIQETLRSYLHWVSKRVGLGGPQPLREPPGGDLLWALRDVSFEVRQGELLGILGHNGAGKSVLLKILSRITTPTMGHAEVYGRVGSLLEIGTGFHPELTGAENIFLNGAILGMSKQEIQERFDEIVDFSGITRFLDTPVKHYSSGMALRLAFSVAVHMEADIIFLDEVWAAGDENFQKKSLKKMNELIGGGRTVLIASHGLAQLRSLCNRVILLDHGQLLMQGAPDEVIRYYDSIDARLDGGVPGAA